MVLRHNGPLSREVKLTFDWSAAQNPFHKSRPQDKLRKNTKWFIRLRTLSSIKNANRQQKQRVNLRVSKQEQ